MVRIVYYLWTTGISSQDDKFPSLFAKSQGMTRDDHPNVSDQLYANYAIGQDADGLFSDA